MLKVILVDDEPNANEALSAVLANSPIPVEVKKICFNTREASSAIIAHRPDLIFLDVMMPEETGVDFLKRLDKFDFSVVFVTAFSDFALDAIKLSALDYIVKPILAQDVYDAVKKATTHKDEQQKLDQFEVLFNAYRGVRSHIMLPHKNGEYLIVRFDELLYCKADGHTTQFFIERGQRLTSGNNLGEYKSILAEAGFLQTHHSFFVNTSKIISYDTGEQSLKLSGCSQTIPISGTYKPHVINWLKRKGLEHI